MITGGFGMTLDMKTGAMRRWFMGRDGVKRWADNNNPVGACRCLEGDLESRDESQCRMTHERRYAIPAGDIER